MSEPTLLQIRDLYKSFGGVAASDHIDLDVRPGEIHAIIGPNGAGKTTLIAQLAGELKSDGGTVEFMGRDITHEPAHVRALMGLSRSFQITSIVHDMTVIDNVALSVQAHQGHSFKFWQSARQDEKLLAPAMHALAQVGLADQAYTVSRYMSHGEHRQLEIAMALASDPSLLLLDEPMAGMGTEETQRMVEILSRLKNDKTMLLIEHDMDVVFSLADRVTVLVYGRVIATDSPQNIRMNEDVRRAYLGDEEVTAHA
jgi:branched-chain amino acid transport system ATP-binding protein